MDAVSTQATFGAESSLAIAVDGSYRGAAIVRDGISSRRLVCRAAAVIAWMSLLTQRSRLAE